MTHPPHILLVDDDQGPASPLCAYLSMFGFQAHAVADGLAMQQHLDQHAVDLVVLDLLRPGVEGLGLTRLLRERSRLPLILISARGSAADRVVGLEMGADDCLSKPFEPRELVARIHSVLRRAASPAAPPRAGPDVVAFDGWRLDREQRQLTAPSGAEVPLSNAEFQLLSAFLQAPRRVVSRDQLVALARGRASDDSGRSIDLLVSRLRHKLAGDGEAGDGHDGPDALIRTVRGAGYLFNAQHVQAHTHRAAAAR